MPQNRLQSWSRHTIGSTGQQSKRSLGTIGMGADMEVLAKTHYWQLISKIMCIQAYPIQVVYIRTRNANQMQTLVYTKSSYLNTITYLTPLLTRRMPSNVGTGKHAISSEMAQHKPHQNNLIKFTICNNRNYTTTHSSLVKSMCYIIWLDNLILLQWQSDTVYEMHIYSTLISLICTGSYIVSIDYSHFWWLYNIKLKCFTHFRMVACSSFL